MKKVPKKLRLRRESLRALTASTAALAHVAGGGSKRCGDDAGDSMLPFDDAGDGNSLALTSAKL